MSSTSDKRHTQIDLETLGGLKPRPLTAGLRGRLVERENPFGDRPVLERDAVNVSITKRARSPDGTHNWSKASPAPGSC